MTTARRIRIGIVGLGKISRDQHIPAIAADPAFELVAAASPNATHEALRVYPNLEALLAGEPDLDAVALNTPPKVRFDLARTALAAGKHVLLEKPPGSTLGELEILKDLAAQAGRTVFSAWHSQHAPAVEPLRAWLAERALKAVRIVWKEDVRRWHPGQAWIWEPGQLGVFDPGINALSILTRVAPERFVLTDATLEFPRNRQAPIAARLSMRSERGAAATAEFDWRQTGPQTWDIEVETDRGSARLSFGGRRLEVDGEPAFDAPEREYPELYRAFSALIAEGRSDLDAEPLRLVADAFLLGARHETEPFED